MTRIRHLCATKKRKTPKSEVLVSIITPVYNTKPQYLRKCIESVLAQSFSNFEFLLCDDCSEPYIKKIIDSYDDERIVYYRNEKNLSAAGSRNVLIDVAKGKYLALLDSDDTIHPDRLKKQVEFLDNNLRVGLLGTLATVNNKHLFVKEKFSNEELERHLVFNGCALVNSSVMLRKQVLDQHKIRYKKEYVPAEDYALWCDLIGLTEFALLPEVLCNYRSYSDNISHRQNKLQKYKAALIQYAAIEKYNNIVILDKDCLADFAALNIPKKPQRLIKAIDHVLEQLSDIQDNRQKFYEKYTNCYRLICYKTYSLPKQTILLFSPLRKFFNQSIWWQIFCFVTRGLLCFTKRGRK